MLGNWVRPVAVILSAIPTGALQNPSRSSGLQSQVAFTNYNLRSGNIAVSLEPVSQLETAYSNLSSWMDIDTMCEFVQTMLPMMPSFSEFQAFGTHYVTDLRPQLRGMGDSPQMLSITANRVDTNGAVDYIATIVCLKELTYEIKGDSVSVRQTA